MPGRLESEQGPVGGGCCGRVDADCDLGQVNVRVEIVKRDRTIFTVARWNETRCTIVKPLSYRMFRR